MSHSVFDLQQQQQQQQQRHLRDDSVMHFKKKWLQEERAASAARCEQPRTFTPLLQTLPAFRAPTSLPSASLSSSLMAEPTSEAAYHRLSNATATPISLNIPRFAKYGLHSGLPSHLTMESSALSSAAGTADLPWLFPHTPEAFKLQFDTDKRRKSGGSRKSLAAAERPLIDINQPPPSPTHSMDSEVAPCTPCSAPLVPDATRSPSAPSAFPHSLPVMDYSIPASPNHSCWLAGSGDSNNINSNNNNNNNSSLRAMMSRRGANALGLLHMPHLSPATSELPQRSTDLSLRLPAQQSPTPPLGEDPRASQSASPRSVLRRGVVVCHSSQGGVVCPSSSSPSQGASLLRKPRSGPWHLADDLSLPATAHQKYASRMVLHAEEAFPEEEDGEEDEVSGEQEGRMSKREGSEDEEQSKGGTPKACLHCGTTKTPLWRNGPPGPKSLCNACGIRFNKIRSGKRKPTAKEASMLMKYERSNSVNSGCSEVLPASEKKHSIHQHQQQQHQQHQQQQQQQQGLSQSTSLVPLPVPTAHKSRSKLSQQGRQGSAVSSLVFGAEGEEGLRERKRGSPETPSKPQEDALEGRPLRMAFQPRLKKLCLAPSRASCASGEASSPLSPQRKGAESCKSENLEARGEREDASSSDLESCLSEPVHSPAPYSPPHSPPLTPREGRMGAAVGASRASSADTCADVAREEEQGKEVRMEEGSEEEESDVEAGARLLMEILHSEPAAAAAVACS